MSGFPAEALHRAMVIRGWGIADLAAAAGIDRATVRALLAGRRPTLRTEARITAAIAAKPVSDEVRAALKELAS